MLSDRTCANSEINSSLVGKSATLFGWVSHRRDHGNLIFIDLRDRSGISQIVFNPEVNESAYKIGSSLRNEYCIRVSGVVQKRPEGTVNKEISSGEVELIVDSVELFSSSAPLPLDLDERKLASEETRMKYRYLDLRRKAMFDNLFFRHKFIKAFRDFFDSEGFLEVETPFLSKSTPEGARDYLVPVRNPKHSFFALPQSPQIYKQLLMVAGFEKYFQIVKCFRDEDLRADRQPEFTQVDLELSFVDEEDIYFLIENCVCFVLERVLSKKISTPFPRLTYYEAMEMYGVDKPDTRFDLHLINLTEKLKNSSFNIFSSAIESNNLIKAIVVPNGASFSRKQIDKLQDFVKIFKAKGLVSLKLLSSGIESPVLQHLSKDDVDTIVSSCNAKENDLILIVADSFKVTNAALGNLRNKLAKDLNLIDNSKFNFLWVTEFPLFEWGEEEQRFKSMHHPFTYPFLEDLPLLKSAPDKVRSRAYDLVLNGSEVGGGSVRIHNSEHQSLVFDALGISEDDAQQKFGFLLDAFKYGPPPHAGMAFGLDRFVAILLGLDNIREIIAFPKNKSGIALMESAPSSVDSSQLDEVNLYLKKSDLDLVNNLKK